MSTKLITAFDLAQRYIGIKELTGEKNHPLIQWWLSLCGFSLDTPDEIPWCSAFVNGIAWELRLPRSKSAAARSWLGVGMSVDILSAMPGFDVVILQRGKGTQAGHVGFYVGQNKTFVQVLGGNQSNSVSIAPFDRESILGIHRLTWGI